MQREVDREEAVEGDDDRGRQLPEELALRAEAREVVNGLTLTLTRPYPGLTLTCHQKRDR